MDPQFRNLSYQKEKLEENLISFSDDDQIRIHEAIIFAEDAHQEQKRDEGDPYIIHPIRVTRNLIEGMGVTDPDLICAALLHDVLEDTEETRATIASRFGGRVADLVEHLSQDKVHETKTQYINRIVDGPLEIRLAKCADKLDNTRSMLLRTDRGNRWKRHVRETKESYLPLAESTGNQWAIEEMQKAYDAIPDKD